MSIHGFDHSFDTPPLLPPLRFDLIDGSLEQGRRDHAIPLGESINRGFDEGYQRGYQRGYQSMDSIRSYGFLPTIGRHRNFIDSSMLSKLGCHFSNTQRLTPGSAVSPFSHASPSISRFRSSITDVIDFERSTVPRNSNDATVSSYDARNNDTELPMETSQVQERAGSRERDLERDTEYCQAGKKRRVFSDDIPFPSDRLDPTSPCAPPLSAATSPPPKEIPKNPSRVKKGHICGCCPKNPKKFETEEELKTHVEKKQYKCSYCRSWFTNKNEVERHEKSLHIRHDSWSCWALSYEGAFHNSTTQPGEADTCGFCGNDFSTEQDWEERIRHLCNVHSFQVCNPYKAFYRADNFRQHLKHCHEGIGGRWLYILENACKREEKEAPVPSEGSHSTAIAAKRKTKRQSTEGG